VFGGKEHFCRALVLLCVCQSEYHLAGVLRVSRQEVHSQLFERDEQRGCRDVAVEELEDANVRQSEELGLPDVVFLEPGCLNPQFEELTAHNRLDYWSARVYEFILACFLNCLG